MTGTLGEGLIIICRFGGEGEEGGAAQKGEGLVKFREIHMIFRRTKAVIYYNCYDIWGREEGGRIKWWCPNKSTDLPPPHLPNLSQGHYYLAPK